jgi:hypothetical protein
MCKALSGLRITVGHAGIGLDRRRRSEAIVSPIGVDEHIAALYERLNRIGEQLAALQVSVETCNRLLAATAEGAKSFSDACRARHEELSELVARLRVRLGVEAGEHDGEKWARGHLHGKGTAWGTIVMAAATVLIAVDVIMRFVGR